MFAKHNKSKQNATTHLWTLFAIKLKRITHNLLSCSGNTFLYEFIVDVFMYKRPRTSRAHLALIHEHRLMGLFHCVVNCNHKTYNLVISRILVCNTLLMMSSIQTIYLPTAHGDEVGDCLAQRVTSMGYFTASHHFC